MPQSIFAGMPSSNPNDPFAKPRGVASSDIAIRRVLVTDVDALLGLRRDALTNNPTSFGSSPEEMVHAEWSARITRGATASDQAIFLAEHDRMPVAMAGIFRTGGQKRRHGALIWGVYVDPAYRGVGLARSLVNACIDWARACDVSIVRLTGGR
jgi:GNAT superfamily N-acetyltransferase